MCLTSGDIRGTGSPGFLSGLSIPWWHAAMSASRISSQSRHQHSVAGSIASPRWSEAGEEVDDIFD
jgi:hypothetical protein